MLKSNIRYNQTSSVPQTSKRRRPLSVSSNEITKEKFAGMKKRFRVSYLNDEKFVHNDEKFVPR